MKKVNWKLFIAIALMFGGSTYSFAQPGTLGAVKGDPDGYTSTSINLVGVHPIVTHPGMRVATLQEPLIVQVRTRNGAVVLNQVVTTANEKDALLNQFAGQKYFVEVKRRKAKL